MEELLKQLLLCKIDAEYKRYQANVLTLSNIRIYEMCYEIDCIVNFYEIMLEKIPAMSEETLLKLVSVDDLLHYMYGEWLSKDDSNYAELEDHVTEELEKIISRMEEQQKKGGQKSNGKEEYPLAS